MERVQHMTKSAIRRASQIEVNPQAKRNLQELFVNFTLILICLLLIYIIVLLSSWGAADRLAAGCTWIWLRCGLPLHTSARSCLTLGTQSSNKFPPPPHARPPFPFLFLLEIIFPFIFLLPASSDTARKDKMEKTLKCVMLLYQNQVINVTQYIYLNRRCLTCEYF